MGRARTLILIRLIQEDALEPEKENLKPRHILYLTNPGSARGAQAVEPVVEVFQHHGVNCEHRELTLETRIPDELERGASSFDAIVLGGGDGTLNSAAADIVESGLPLGIIPLGTANDFAKSLSIPADPVAAAELVCQGRLDNVYLARINDNYCFNAANIGLGYKVRKENTHMVKRIWGFLSYAIAMLSAYRKQQPFMVQIKTGHQVYNMRCLQVCVGSGRYYGGGAQIAWDADPRDKNLVLYALERRHFLSMLKIGRALHRGELERIQSATRMDGDYFQISTTPVQGVTVDGEEAGLTPVECCLVSDPLQVFVP